MLDEATLLHMYPWGFCSHSQVLVGMGSRSPRNLQILKFLVLDGTEFVHDLCISSGVLQLISGLLIIPNTM